VKAHTSTAAATLARTPEIHFLTELPEVSSLIETTGAAEFITAA
jgi:hypothetical protein